MQGAAAFADRRRKAAVCADRAFDGNGIDTQRIAASFRAAFGLFFSDAADRGLSAGAPVRPALALPVADRRDGTVAG